MPRAIGATTRAKPSFCTTLMSRQPSGNGASLEALVLGASMQQTTGANTRLLVTWRRLWTRCLRMYACNHAYDLELLVDLRSLDDEADCPLSILQHSRRSSPWRQNPSRFHSSPAALSSSWCGRKLFRKYVEDRKGLVHWHNKVGF